MVLWNVEDAVCVKQVSSVERDPLQSAQCVETANQKEK